MYVRTSYVRTSYDFLMQIAIDSINNYQTVSALSVEEQLLAKYSKTLDKAYRYVRTYVHYNYNYVCKLWGDQGM